MSNGWLIGPPSIRGCGQSSCEAAQRFATSSVYPGSRVSSRVRLGEDPPTLDERQLASCLGDLVRRVREEVAVEGGQIRELADLDRARLPVEVVRERGPGREGSDRRRQVEPLIR